MPPYGYLIELPLQRRAAPFGARGLPTAPLDPDRPIINDQT
jgi:hypothetical protein